MRYCRFCGKELRDKDRFCSSCGRAQDEIIERPDNFRGRGINEECCSTNVGDNKGRAYAIIAIVLAIFMPLLGIIFACMSLRCTGKGVRNILAIVALVLAIAFFCGHTFFMNGCHWLF